jgi:phospholipase/carboxylesterase
MTRAIIVRAGAIAFLCAAALLPLPAQTVPAKTAPVDWAHPESINIYNPGLPNSPGVDLKGLDQKANDAYQAKQYESAARYYLAEIHYDSANAGATYNLACCYGLLGRETLAATYLTRSYKAGFEDIEHIRHDPDFDKVREKPVFAAAVKTLDSTAKAKEADLGELVYVTAPTMLRCRVHPPNNYDSTRAYPLVVALHGHGDNSDHFSRIWRRFGDTSLILAFPQGPYPFTLPNKQIGYSWITDDSASAELSSRMSVDYVVSVTNWLKQHYKVSDVYLMGLSQGCLFTYSTGIRNPELYKGLICISGWLDTTEVNPELLKAGKGLRVFIAHSKQDQIVEYRVGTESRDILRKYGYDVTFVDFEGAHGLLKAEVLQQAVRWMKK